MHDKFSQFQTFIQASFPKTKFDSLIFCLSQPKIFIYSRNLDEQINICISVLYFPNLIEIIDFKIIKK